MTQDITLHAAILLIPVFIAKSGQTRAYSHTTARSEKVACSLLGGWAIHECVSPQSHNATVREAGVTLQLVTYGSHHSVIIVTLEGGGSNAYSDGVLDI